MEKPFASIVKFLKQKNMERRRRREERRGKNYPCALGVLGIMKNESMNLDEWVMHYRKLGAEKIYLIDNGSTDDTVAKAQVWVAKGVVDLIERPVQHLQVPHYWDAIKTFNIRKTCEWLLIADLDEFWFCPNGSTLAEKLKDFTAFDVIYGNWRNFGSSGLVDHPASIRTSFIHSNPRLTVHLNTKYFCRTSVIKSEKTIRIHKILGADSYRTVSDNENFNLFHYPSQSLEYFKAVKMTRGDVNTAKSDHVRGMDYFTAYDAPCTVENRILADLVQSGRLGTG